MGPSPRASTILACARAFPTRSKSSSTSVWSASAARNVSSIKETCSSTSKKSADLMHNFSSSANNRFNRSLRATSFLLLLLGIRSGRHGIHYL
ncbi:N-succinylarginine dihydrolase [Trichinella pseudospiralis]